MTSPPTRVQLTRPRLHLIQELNNSLPLLILTPSKPFHPMRIRLLRKRRSGRMDIRKRNHPTFDLVSGRRGRVGRRGFSVRSGLGAGCGWCGCFCVFVIWVKGGVGFRPLGIGRVRGGEFGLGGIERVGIGEI